MHVVCGFLRKKNIQCFFYKSETVEKACVPVDPWLELYALTIWFMFWMFVFFRNWTNMVQQGITSTAVGSQLYLLRFYCPWFKALSCRKLCILLLLCSGGLFSLHSVKLCSHALSLGSPFWRHRCSIEIIFPENCVSPKSLNSAMWGERACC